MSKEVELLKKHFPHAKIDEDFVIFVSPEWLLARSFTSATSPENAKKIKRDIDDLERSMRRVWQLYIKLPLQVRPGGHIYRDLANMTRRITGDAIFKSQQRQQGAAEEMRSNVEQLRRLSKQAIANEHEAKIQLIDTARELWWIYTGSEAPKKTNTGPYFAFVEDLIAHAGKAWSTESAIRAWHAFHKDG